MKTRMGLLVLLATMLPMMACTHRQTLDASSGPEAYFDANRMTASREAEVVTRDGQVYRWRDVHLTPDSTFALGVAGSSLPTEQVYEVTVRSRWKGALEGARIGAGPGALIGAMGRKCTYTKSSGTVCAGAAEALAIGAVSGASYGAIIGVIRSRREKVEVVPSASPRVGINV